jgi:nucleotide-binding universal stress UspA family protein
MPTDTDYNGGSEADRKRIPAVRQPTLAVGGTTRYILSNAQLPVLMAH